MMKQQGVQSKQSLIFKPSLLLLSFLCLSFMGMQFSCVSTTENLTETDFVPEGETILWESYEGEPKWFNAVVDDDSSLKAGQSTAWATEGGHSLEGSFSLNGKNGATFYTDGFSENNWSAYTGIAVDVNNTAGEGLEIAFVLKTGPDWAWQETAVVRLKKGVTKNLRFHFYNNTMKSERTNWQTTGSLKGADDIKMAAFKFFGPAGLKGTVYIDNIRFIKKGTEESGMDRKDKKKV
jgi:hypothetical protein